MSLFGEKDATEEINELIIAFWRLGERGSFEGNNVYPNSVDASVGQPLTPWDR